MDDMTLINPDILEILLSETYQVSCVLNGLIASYLRHVTETHAGNYSYYITERVLTHGSLEALDPEYLKPFCDNLYIPDDSWYRAIKNAPNKLRLKGINMDYVKYSHIDINLLEYNSYLYNKLEQQTNMLDPVELGKRIVFLPGDIPQNFDDFFKLYEPLTEEFKVTIKYLRLAHDIDIEITDSQTMSMVLDDVFGPCSEERLEQIKQEIVDFMSDRIDESGLRISDLEKFREKYDACIKVTSENKRLYTRARYILNTFVELNDHVIKHVVSNAKLGYTDTVLNAHEYLGVTAKNILKHFNTIYLDEDNYPSFSTLHTQGLISNRAFPESSIYTNIQQQCFCGWCKPFKYTARLYESNTGDVYILVNLKVKYENFFDYIISKKCAYHLFLFDKDYHYMRLDSLASYRYNVEVKAHKVIHFNMEYLHKNYGKYYHNWFSSSYRMQRCMLDAERIMQTVRDDY